MLRALFVPVVPLTADGAASLTDRYGESGWTAHTPRDLAWQGVPFARLVESLLVPEPLPWADVWYPADDADTLCDYDHALAELVRLQPRLERLPCPVHRRVARADVVAAEGIEPTVHIDACCEALEELIERTRVEATEGLPLPPEPVPEAFAPRILAGQLPLPHVAFDPPASSRR